jgi:hypothetical protein
MKRYTVIAVARTIMMMMIMMVVIMMTIMEEGGVDTRHSSHHMVHAFPIESFRVHQNHKNNNYNPPRRHAATFTTRRHEQPLNPSHQHQHDNHPHLNQRRSVLRRLGVMTMSTFLLPSLTNAFPNKISKQYDDRPKRRGPQVRPLLFISYVSLFLIRFTLRRLVDLSLQYDCRINSHPIWGYVHAPTMPVRNTSD